MKLVILLVTLIALALGGCSATGNELRDSILSEAHRCCVSSCTSEEIKLLRLQLASYMSENEDKADSMKQYIELSLSGQACTTPKSKRASTINVTVANAGPFDVANGPVNFDAVFSLTITPGIYYAYIYAYIYYGGTSRTIYPTNYYYSDEFANATSSFTKTVTFTIPQYAANGTWTITAYGYGLGATQYTATTKTFTVAKTVNDIAAPKLVSVYAPTFNLNDDTFSLYFGATDDVSGVQMVYVYVQNTTHSIAYGYWYTSYDPLGYYIGKKNVSDGVQLSIYYNNQIVSGTYYITIYVYDVAGHYVYYDWTQLAALGLQNNVTFAVGDCRAGRFRPYLATTPCTLCDKGTYGNQGSFKCKACKIGTTNNIAGANNCSLCTPGTSSSGGDVDCDPCPAGTYSYSYGADICYPCPPGYNSSIEGAENCQPCPYGSYSTGGAVTCTVCPVGTYGSYAAFACSPCEPGTYTNTKGTQQCTPCSAGTYAAQGATACTACPVTKPNGPPGSNSQLNCYL